MTLLICKDGLIGDFLGIIPVMTELAKRNELHVSIPTEAEPIYHLIAKKYNIGLQEKEAEQYDTVIELDVSKAFGLACLHHYYMSQSHFACLGMPVPATPPKAELQFEETDVPVYDYILAPFSRSLPPQQRWPKERWQELVRLMPGSSFCVIGHGRDEREFTTGGNVSQMYNQPLVDVLRVLKKARKGLISVVSGPSHCAFHLGVKNYLLTNQAMTWGNNPDAVSVQDYIPDLTVEKLIAVLNTDYMRTGFIDLSTG
jgi:ADP-heptose:LPS heptosyltransferase